MYAATVILPVSGVVMGVFGGKGLPFFGSTINFPAVTPDGALAKQAYKVHTLTGQAFEYLLALHVGAVGFYQLRGVNVLRRMNPFGGV